MSRVSIYEIAEVHGVMVNILTKLANTLTKYYLATPWAFRWLYWLLPVVYFLIPLDLDRLGLAGRLDDILLMGFCFWALGRSDRLKSFFEEVKTAGRSNKTHQKPSEPEFVEELADPFEILGLRPGASRSELKTAYRNLLSLYHPDKFAHLGADFERIAQRRTQRIIAAYQGLCR